MLKDLHDWRIKNPLLMYRVKRKVTMADAATVIGVSAVSISSWEMGKTTPSDENLELITLFIRDDNTASKWKRWMRNRPTIDAQAR